MYEEYSKYKFNPAEEKFAIDTIERYSGSDAKDFQPYLLLTNFPRYVQKFADDRNLQVLQGSAFSVVHSPLEKVSILDYKIGSPAAALIIDLCAFLPIRAALMLGMCGGLRKHYKIGDYFLPVSSIRGEGTSDFYFPREVPAMANFLVQKCATNVLEENKVTYHIGITHTTNKRFWEFNKNFRKVLEVTRPQAIEMECATLFMASYFHKLPLGALLLISDLPLGKGGIKTKKSSEKVYVEYMEGHINKGVEIMKELDKALKHQAKGVFRGVRKRFETRKG